MIFRFIDELEQNELELAELTASIASRQSLLDNQLALESASNLVVKTITSNKTSEDCGPSGLDCKVNDSTGPNRESTSSSGVSSDCSVNEPRNSNTNHAIDNEHLKKRHPLIGKKSPPIMYVSTATGRVRIMSPEESSDSSLQDSDSAVCSLGSSETQSDLEKSIANANAYAKATGIACAGINEKRAKETLV